MFLLQGRMYALSLSCCHLAHFHISYNLSKLHLEAAMRNGHMPQHDFPVSATYLLWCRTTYFNIPDPMKQLELDSFYFQSKFLRMHASASLESGVTAAEEDVSFSNEFTASQPGQKLQKWVEIRWMFVNNLTVPPPSLQPGFCIMK